MASKRICMGDRTQHIMKVCEDGYKRCERCGTLSPKGVPAEVRFWEKVDRNGPMSSRLKRPDLGNCWIWKGFINDTGYGHFHPGNPVRADITLKAHRFAWSLIYGVIPDGMDLDHLCYTPACVRPSHLEPVTRRENHFRRRSGTICKHGHQMDITRRTSADGKTFCGTCFDNRKAAERAARKALGKKLGRPKKVVSL